MNKLLTRIFLLSTIIFVSFNLSEKSSFVNGENKEKIIECSPYIYDYDPNAKSFVLKPYQTIITRKNFNNLNAYEKTCIRTAVRKMKLLDVGVAITNLDKTGWEYQARLHFQKCQHGTCKFLAWHRLYIYFFERILRNKMPGPTNLKPALPYWDYQTSNQIPSWFRLPSSTSNSLYNNTRDVTLNNGGSLVSYISVGTTHSISVDINDALNNYTDFYLFQKKLESPHGGVHNSIGGDLATAFSPRDPLFWLHHANIDRLWEVWLNKSGGRCNPNDMEDPAWWNHKYTFYDEFGGPVTMSGKDMVKISSQLGYKYSGVANPPIVDLKDCKRTYKDCPKDADLPKVILIYPNHKIDKLYTEFKFSKGDIKQIDSIVDVVKLNRFNFNSTAINLEFENININKNFFGVVETYINPSSNENLNPSDASYVGILDLFTASMINNHKEHQDNKTILIPITEVIKKLNLNFSDLRNLKVAFRTRGNYLNNKEIKPSGMNIKLGKVSLVVYTLK